MEYTEVSPKERLSGLRSRVRQLEELYFEKELLADEAEFVGNSKEAGQFRELCLELQSRKHFVLGKIEKLSELVDSEEENESTV